MSAKWALPAWTGPDSPQTPVKVCQECDGTGAVWADPHVCTCGTGPEGYYGQHERGCGSEPCPNGCPYVGTTA